MFHHTVMGCVNHFEDFDSAVRDAASYLYQSPSNLKTRIREDGAVRAILTRTDTGIRMDYKGRDASEFFPDATLVEWRFARGVGA